MRPAVAIKIGRRLRLRQAVEAAEVTSIRNTHAQVAQNAAMRIDQQVGGHWPFGVPVELESGLPRPFCCNSISSRLSGLSEDGEVARSLSAPFLSRRL